MAEMTSHPPGTCCWVDLATPGPHGAEAFYGSAFGGTAEDPYTDQAVPCTLLSDTGRQARGPDQPSPGPGRMSDGSSSASATDEDATAGRARALGPTLEAAARLGGSALMGSREVERVGRFADLRVPPGRHLRGD